LKEFYMSRTFRRKEDKGGWRGSKSNYLRECVQVEGWSHWVWVPLEPGSVEYQKESAKYHSDAGSHNFKEPGPGWFRNLFATRPNRRYNKNELRKFVLNPEYDPEILDNNAKILPYWT
jgi:hypothetical protein